jgi:hypothetical protein
MHARDQIDAFQRLLGALHPLFGGSAVIDQRQLDIVQSRRAWQQVESLEDETYFLIPDIGKLIIVKIADEAPSQPIAPGTRRIQAAD